MPHRLDYEPKPKVDSPEATPATGLLGRFPLVVVLIAYLAIKFVYLLLSSRP